MREVVPVHVRCTVNGRSVEAEVEPRQLLVDFLRQNLGLTGTHVGCEQGICGACTVLLDGRPVRSCLMLAVQAEGRSLTTIEGVAAEDGSLHPVQQAFWEHHALQCGFCTPGLILEAIALLTEEPEADEAAIREAIAGNLCRCTGYQNIVRAIESAGRRMASVGRETR